MDSVFREVYVPVTHLWSKNGVEADCRALSEQELMKEMYEVRRFNEKLQSSCEYELIFLSDYYPQHRVFIYQNYRRFTHPAAADSLKRWIEVAEERVGKSLSEAVPNSEGATHEE